jgi:hypothetical protein
MREKMASKGLMKRSDCVPGPKNMARKADYDLSPQQVTAWPRMGGH